MAQIENSPRSAAKIEVDLSRSEAPLPDGVRQSVQAGLPLERNELEKGLDKQQLAKLVPSGSPELKAAVTELASTPTGAKVVNWLASNGWRIGVPPSLTAGGGTIDFENKIILVQRNMVQQPKELLAGVIAHETFHAMRYAQTGYNQDAWAANFGKKEEFAGLLLQGKVTLEAEGRPATVDAALNRIAEAFQVRSVGDLVRQKYGQAPHNPADTSFTDLERRGLVPRGWAQAAEQRYQEVLSGKR